MSKPTQDAANALYLARVADMIRENGWVVQAVGGDLHAMGYSYTVGLTARGLPELWLGSLAPHQATPLLNDLASRAVEGVPLPVGEPLDVGWSVPVRLRGPVSVEAAEVFVAESMHPDAEVSVLQVLWPDAVGGFPDQRHYDKARFPQRLLPMAGGA